MLQRLPQPAHEEAWANGAGRTSVLAIDQDARRWRWRVSIAHIQQAAAFSDYPGVLRQLAPLDARLDLVMDDGSRTIHLARLQTVRFTGTPAPTARLPDGPTRVFNLMTRADVQAMLLARPLLGELLLPRADCWLCHLSTGRAQLQQYERTLDLTGGETARIDGGCRLSGHGEVLLVRFDQGFDPD